jgi:hypothetical protein
MASLNVADRNKLGPKFYWPFRIKEQVNEVAYRLELLSGWLPPIRHGRACLEQATATKSHLTHEKLNY